MGKDIIYKSANILTEKIGSGKIFIASDFPDSYNFDKTSDLRGLAEMLIIPDNVNDVASALSILNEAGIAVITRGAGTGVTGGALPINGGAVLSLEKLNRIIEIDEGNLTATVEPCVKTAELQRAALSCGLFYPPDPASLEDCSIAGNVAESSGGMRAVKYGTTKDYILGAEFVTADGTIMHTGGKFVKNAAGYNICGLLTGSEGTLAVITRLIMRLIPAPKETRDLLISFDSLEKAAMAVKLISDSRVVPAAVEFMEEEAIRFVAKHSAVKIPFSDAGAHLLVQIDGNSTEDVLRQEKEIIKAVKPVAASHLSAETEEQKTNLWSARRGIRTAIEKESPVFLAEDCAVPRAAIPVFVKETKDFLRSRNLHSIIFGHAGDGNVHIDTLKHDMDYDKWKEILPSIKKGIYETALRHGGTITGEHGIGCVRRDYMSLAFSKDEIDLMKRIKLAFDPKGILNPGKMI